LIAYPSHCTHILQPLDVGIFGPFKKYFKKEKRSFSKTEIDFGDVNASDKSKSRVRNVYAAIKAIHSSCVPITIRKAFTRSGLWPREKNMSLSNDRIVRVQNEETSNNVLKLNSGKRKRISIEGTMATSDDVIKALNDQTAEDSKQYDFLYITNFNYRF